MVCSLCKNPVDQKLTTGWTSASARSDLWLRIDQIHTILFVEGRAPNLKELIGTSAADCAGTSLWPVSDSEPDERPGSSVAATSNVRPDSPALSSDSQIPYLAA